MDSSPSRADDDDSARHDRRARIQRLLDPRHIAFVGGRNVLAGIDLCKRSAYAGRLYLVNDRGASAAGAMTAPNIAELPETPDATFIGVKREATIDVLRQLAARDAPSAVCFAAGFAEIGGDGPDLQRALVDASGRMAVLGPNCLGIVNRVRGASLWLVPGGTSRIARGPALISQSGGLGLHIKMNQRSVDFAYVISVGNQAVLGVEDFLDVLVDDPHVSAIGIYLEALRDVPGFHAAALRALGRNVPIVVLKGGTSAIGAAMTMTHTSSLAGQPELYAALFDRLGVANAASPSELIETLKLFDVGKRPAGARTVVFTCSGGSSSVAADVAERVGLALPSLPADRAETIRAMLPAFASVSNPLDYNTSLWGKEEELVQVFGAALGPQVDSGVLAIDFTPPEYGACEHEFAVCRALIRAGKASGVPVFVASILADLLPEEARRFLIANGVAPLQGVQDGLAAIAAAARFTAARDGAPPAPLPRLAAIGHASWLDEVESKALLAAHGLAVPPSRVVTPAEAPGAATALGFPVAVKAVSARLPHKTEAGAVRLSLRDASAVAAAAKAIVAATRAAIGEAPTRLLVERMITDVVAEIIVGAVRHASFGLVLAIGSGGTLVEILRDSALLLLPTDEGAIRRAIAGLRIARVLDGVRGRPAGDVDAVVAAALAVQRFALAAADRVAEIDVNPLLVRPRGLGAVAVDALIRRV